MSHSVRSLLRLIVCGVLLVSAPGVAAAQVFVLADYAPFDPGNTWDRETTLNSVLQGITRRTVLQQTKNIGGTETRILENSRSGSRTFMTNDAAGLRQHGWFMPASGNGSDVTGTFAPPLVLAEAVVGDGWRVLGGQNHRGNPHGTVVVILDGDLGLGVGSQVLQLAAPVAGEHQDGHSPGGRSRPQVAAAVADHVGA